MKGETFPVSGTENSVVTLPGPLYLQRNGTTASQFLV